MRGGDHEPFLSAGFAAARFTEPNENFAHQHQNTRIDPATGLQFGDLIEFVDMDFTARVARVNAAAIWSLAQAPGTPKNVKMDTSVLTNNSTLGWTLDTSPGGACWVSESGDGTTVERQCDIWSQSGGQKRVS